MKLEVVNSRMNMSPNIDGFPLKDVSSQLWCHIDF